MLRHSARLQLTLFQVNKGQVRTLICDDIISDIQQLNAHYAHTVEVYDERDSTRVLLVCIVDGIHQLSKKMVVLLYIII
jgi:hypothetical protein